MQQNDTLQTEIELISSTLLPTETLKTSFDSEECMITISTTSSSISLHISIEGSYPLKHGVKIVIKGDFGREEGEGWNTWVEERMGDWDPASEYPLYQLLTTHFIPLLSESQFGFSPESPPASSSTTGSRKTPDADDQPEKCHHTLFISHHLIAPSKRKDLLALSKQLNLRGFCKIGYPGILYVCGGKDEVEDWTREVKTWQWLALRSKSGVEECAPLDDGPREDVRTRNDTEVQVKGKEKGEWKEVDKIGEALDWLRGYGREEILLNLGFGGKSEK